MLYAIHYSYGAYNKVDVTPRYAAWKVMFILRLWRPARQCRYSQCHSQLYDRSLGLSALLHNAHGESAGWLSPVWLRVPSVSRLLRYVQSSTSALTCLARTWLQYVRARHCQKRPVCLSVCLSVCLPFAIVSRAFTVQDIKILFKGRGRYGLFR